MTQLSDAQHLLRRARPLLGTLVEVGIRRSGAEDVGAVETAFQAIQAVQRVLSRFDPASEVCRFHALAPGQMMRVNPITQDVLAAARELWLVSDGVFDISLGTAPEGWRCEGADLRKLSDGVRFDLGGIAKGHAVDLAVQALQKCGCDAGWVNAGGDLRAFGDIDVPVMLRDEASGGARHFATVQDCAFATSHFGTATRSRVVHGTDASARVAHLSVCAPLCLHADALTKIVAVSGQVSGAILDRYQATAWKH